MLKRTLVTALRRLTAAALADQRAEWQQDFRKLRELNVETRLRLTRLEGQLANALSREAAVAAPDKGAMGPRVPLTLEARQAPSSGPAATGTHPEIAELRACSVCGSGAWTEVCEYNKFLLLDRAPDPEAERYDYAVCHECGILFARRRPFGPRFAALLARFEVSLGRMSEGESTEDRLAFDSAPLTSATERLLRERVAPGVFVSEHAPPGGDHLPELLRDRLSAAQHIELLTSLVPLNRPRVLELRPRFGAIGGGLKRLCGAEVYGLPLFEGQQLINREVYGNVVDHLIDYDRFSIPYEGQFDLIVANHSVTHALHPDEMLRLLHQRLTPGGHLYLYNEPDDAEYLDHHESMFKVLNPFHFQAFDREALLRALRRHRFEPSFVTHERGNLVVLSQRSERQDLFEPIPAAERDARIARYRAARDLSILRLNETRRDMFAGEWEAVVERALAAGLAEMTSGGSVRVRRAAS